MNEKLKEENKKLQKEKDMWEDRFKEKCSEGRRPLCLKQIEEYKEEIEMLKNVICMNFPKNDSFRREYYKLKEEYFKRQIEKYKCQVDPGYY